MKDDRSKNKLIALLIGALLGLVGVLGFAPTAAPGGALMGLFAVSALHNVLHLVTGAILIGAALLDGGRNARGALLVMGAAYAVVTVLGYVMGPALTSLGLAINTYDNLLHLALAAILLGAPLAYRETDAPRPSA